MSTAQEQMEEFQRELAKTARLIADALGIPRLVAWLNRKLS